MIASGHPSGALGQHDRLLPKNSRHHAVMAEGRDLSYPLPTGQGEYAPGPEHRNLVLPKAQWMALMAAADAEDPECRDLNAKRRDLWRITQALPAIGYATVARICPRP